MQELFEESVRDIYNAEKQLIRALPKLIKSCQSDELRNALQNHLMETEEQVRRLEEACRILGFRPSGVMCKGMQGLVEEANEHMKGMKPSPLTDAEIIASAQKAEHYEMAAYGTICEWAKALGHGEALNFFKMNLDEEEKADELLSQLAEGGINERAVEDGRRMTERGESHRSRTATRRRTGTKSRQTSRGGSRTGSRTASRSTSTRTGKSRTGTTKSGGARSTASRGRTTTSSRTASTKSGSRSTTKGRTSRSAPKTASKSAASRGTTRATSKARTTSRSAPKAASRSAASRGTTRATSKTRTTSGSAPKAASRSRTGSRATAKSRSRR